MKKPTLFLFALLATMSLISQVPNMGGMGKMNVGRFYGKLVDSLTGKPVEYAVVQIHGMKFDSVSKSMKPAILGGMLSEGNGDFSIDQLPPFGQFTLKVIALGYKPFEQKVSFNLNFQQMGKDAGSGNWQNALNNVDRDLGNIKITPDVKQFKEVVVDGSDPELELKLDKKVYNVEKNLNSAGGTAEDVMKNVPSVNVDMDGNVTLRNSSPEILIDGKPTTLSLDQIPADAIASIEIITNPSAKYDASGGGGGILNIILKKNRKPGYNGNLRANVDSRLAFGGGLDLNAREGKWNFFINSHFNKRNSLTTGSTERYNLLGNPRTNIFQESENVTEGFFGMGRMGVDYFMNNRNTLTLSGNIVSGSFLPVDLLDYRTDTIYTSDTASSSYHRDGDTYRGFLNMGGSLQFKHLYTKAGKELTADVHYNRSTSGSGGGYKTYYYDEMENPLYDLEQRQEGGGTNEFITLQTDFVNPITDKRKLEMGVKASFKSMLNYSKNYNVDVLTGAEDLLESQSTNYTFFDQIYGAYMTFGEQRKKLGYQLGLRAETSFYTGSLLDSNKNFYIEYPIELFPTGFLSYQLTSKQDLQLSYTRKISRPGFFQLMPFTDYSDSLNLSRGNPELKPEFTNSLELNYMNQFSKGNSFMASVYFKHTTDLMTRYQAYEYDSVLMQSAIINTYKNADQSYSYGLELNLKKTIKSWMDFSINGNIYNSYINGANIDSTLADGLVSWFVKVNTNYKLPKNFSAQISGRYYSKTKLPSGGGGGGRMQSYGQGGGMSGMFWGGTPATAQGYTAANWEVEASVRYEFMKEKRASLTLSVSDIFKSRVTETYSESAYFTQTTIKLRDAQIFKLAFSYRFGKFDVSIFKRKNMKVNMDGMEGGM